MDKITVRTAYGDVSWGMNSLKFLYGSHYEKRYAIMQSLTHYVRNAEKTEFLEESGYTPIVLVNDAPLSIRETILVQIDPYYDFQSESKMLASSVLSTYATVLLADIPYSDEYATLATAYAIVADEYINEQLRISIDDVEMVYEAVPLTPKMLLKFIKPRLRKKGYSVGQNSLTLAESVALQCALAKRIAKVGDKDVVVLYDGLVTDAVNAVLQGMCASEEHVRCIVNAQGAHKIQDVTQYVICGKEAFDCADELAVAHYIEMDMPYAGSTQDALRDIGDVIAGNSTQKNAYLKGCL